MAMQPLRRILPVFIASPGDLNEKRKSAKNIVDAFNTGLGQQLNLVVDLLGWEDTLPGIGRPQALINPDVQRCELFVGLLWKHWGRPTGEYSSGFLEEFELAMERNRLSDSPEVWLSFKSIEPKLLQDPGQQLQQVIDFKQERMLARDCLFKVLVSNLDVGKVR